MIRLNAAETINARIHSGGSPDHFGPLNGRAIITSVDFTIAIASSPSPKLQRPNRISSDDRGEHLVAYRRRTWARRPSTRTSSMNPHRRFRALNPPSDSSSAGAVTRRRGGAC